MKVVRVIAFLLVWAFSYDSMAQCNYTAGHSCSSAPIICDLQCLDGFVGTLLDTSNVIIKDSLIKQPNIICDSGGKPQNMSWFAFIAGSNFVSIEITPFGCINNKGIQAGMFADCNFSDDLLNTIPIESEYLDCNINGSVSDPIVLQSTDLVPGQIYYFYVDGNDADVCSYRVNIITATQFFNLIDLNEFSQGNDTLQICPDRNYKLGIKNFNLDISYYWKINPTTVDYPYSSYTKLDSTTNWQIKEEGIYTISMFASNGCDVTDTISKTLIVKPWENEDFGEKYICENRFPYSGPLNENPNNDFIIGWQGPQITAPGISNFSVNLGNGCFFEQTIDVKQTLLKARKDVVEVDCEPFGYHGFFVDKNIFDVQINIPNIDENGCDSLVQLDAYILNIEGNLQQQACANNKILVGFVESNFSGPPGFQIIYHWKDEFGNNIPDNDANPLNREIIKRTQIFLDIEIRVGAKACTFNIPSLLIDPAFQLPPMPVAMNWDLEICSDEAPVNFSINNQPGVNSYHWTANNGATIVSIDNGGNAVIDFSKASSTSKVCVATENGCGLSPELCSNIVIVQTPSIDFLDDVTICQEDVHIASIASGHQSNFKYNWTYAGAILNSGNATGSGPLQLKYNLPGNYQISAIANNLNCRSLPAIQNVKVVKLVDDPIVSFVPTANSIEVMWQAVPCALEYKFYIENKFIAATQEIRHIISDLSPGKKFNIKVEVFGTDCACGIGNYKGEVSTLNCDEVSLDVTSPQAVICEEDWKTAVKLDVNILGSTYPGIQKWKGKGIDNNGVFIPFDVGKGEHYFSFEYEEAGCLYKDSIKINLVESPKVNLLPTDAECKDDDKGSLSIVPENQNLLFNYFLDGKQENGPRIEDIALGSHTIEIIDGNACSLLKTFQINKSSYPLIEIIGNDGSYFDNQNFKITVKDRNAELNLIDSIEWYVNGSLVCKGNCTALDFKSLEGGSYNHQIIVYYKACIMEELFVVNVQKTPKIFISNVLLLNATNEENKSWKMTSTNPEMKVKSVEVYSRWGEKIFFKQDFEIGNGIVLWDGSINGKDLNPGVYVCRVIYYDELGKLASMVNDITVIK